MIIYADFVILTSDWLAMLCYVSSGSLHHVSEFSCVTV